MPEETKDAKSESSTDTKAEGTDTEKDADTDAADSADEGGEKLPFHTHPRWKKLQGDLKQYKELGLSPAELKAALTKIEKYEAAQAAAAKEADDDEPSAEEKDLAKRRKAARKELSKIAPELDELEATKGRVDLFTKALEHRANKALVSTLTEAGLPTDKANVKAMEEVLATIIQDDEDLFMEYISDPRGAVSEAFKRFSTGFKTAAERSVKADLQAKKMKLLGLPKTHKGGTAETSAKKDDKGPQTLNEARRRAEERLRTLAE